MNGSAYSIYVTFHGGKESKHKKKDKTIVNDVLAVPWTGTAPSQPVSGPYASVLAPASAPYAYDEMRGMVLDAQGLLYVANGAKANSAIYVFSQPSNGVRTPVSVLLQGGTANPGIDHPYGLTIAPPITALASAHGVLYVSNQNSNAVCAYDVQGGTAQLAATPLAVASYLTGSFPAGKFYPGEIVASDKGQSSGGITPPDVRKPAGLSMDFTPAAAAAATSKTTQHSVRGILYIDGALFVANEDNDSLNVYDAVTGALTIALTAHGFKEPVGLAYNPANSQVYVATKSAIFTCDPSDLALVATPYSVSSASGIAAGPDGNVFVASRTDKKLYVLGASAPIEIANNFDDEPECLLTCSA